MMNGLLLTTLLLAARDEANEKALRARLEAIAPAAVATFEDATHALDAGKLEPALTGFRSVVELAPQFDPALRRLCGTLTFLKRYDEGLPFCERAVAIDPSADNETLLLQLLVLRDADLDVQRISDLVGRGLAREPSGSANWVDVKLLSCAHLQRRGGGRSGPCAEELLAAVPENPQANLYAIESAAKRDEWSVAWERLERARPGIDDAEYQRISGLLSASEPPLTKYGRPAVKGVAAWGAALGALITLGMLLSFMTLRTATNLSTARDANAEGRARTLRAVYRAIVGVSSLFYYVSLPLVLVTVVVGCGGLLYGFFAVGHVPIKLAFIVLIMGLFTVFAVFKSVFVSARDEDPGEKLDWAQALKLRALLDRVAATVGTRPVDAVYLTPGCELAVFERGGIRKRWAGTSERCMILGVGVLDGFRVGPFMSVVAHEYGHFSNQDTAGGDLALWARSSLLKLGQALADNGAAAWYNPAWLFFRGYFAVFLRISQGASRLQEVLADRRAIFSYGSQAFRDGYTHVIRRSVAFDAHASATLKEVIEKQKGLSNLYRFVPAETPSSKDLESAFAEVLGAEPSPYDSHPSSRDRLAWAEALAMPGAPDSAASEEVWSLFDSRESVEKLMTTVIRSNIAISHSVAIQEG